MPYATLDKRCGPAAYLSDIGTTSIAGSINSSSLKL